MTKILWPLFFRTRCIAFSILFFRSFFQFPTTIYPASIHHWMLAFNLSHSFFVRLVFSIIHLPQYFLSELTKADEWIVFPPLLASLVSDGSYSEIPVPLVVDAVGSQRRLQCCSAVDCTIMERASSDAADAAAAAASRTDISLKQASGHVQL